MNFLRISSPGVRTVFLVLSFVVAATRVGVGQPNPVPRDFGLDSTAFVALQGRINPSQKIRVRIGLNYAELTRPVLLPEGFTHGPWDSRDTVHVSEVLEIQTRRGSALATGAKTGGVILGTLSLALGVSSMRKCGPSFDVFCDASPGGALVLGVFGAAFGALTGGFIGGVIDLAQPDWKSVYRRSAIGRTLRIHTLTRQRGFAVSTSVAF